MKNLHGLQMTVNAPIQSFNGKFWQVNQGSEAAKNVYELSQISELVYSSESILNVNPSSNYSELE